MRELFTVFSLALFIASLVFGQANIDIPITAGDGISTKSGLAIGVDTAATTGIDEQLGESDLPPFPPAGIFEARFDLSPYAGEPLASYKDYRNAPALPFMGVVEYRLIWQLSEGASAFNIGYNLPPEATIVIKDPLGGILFDSGTLSDSGSFSVPTAFVSLSAVIITMTVAGPCPVLEASIPDPADLQTNVQIEGVSLGWTNGSGTSDVEVWFGPDGRALKLYDGQTINSWPLGTLNYGTQYSWYTVSKNDSCGTQSPIWTFTTIPDTNLLIDSINVYPQNLINWTGSCNTSSKTQVSLVKGYDTELGWMVFDVSAIPNNVTINSVIFNGYLYDNSWPYWSITPMGNVNPVTDAASVVFNQVSAHSGQGIAYSYNEETGTLSNDWLTRTLGSTVTLDLQSSLSKNWFALGILDFDFSTNYFIKFQGWAEANKPFLKVIYSFHGETTFQFTYDYEDRWNLVSIPGLLPGDQQIDDWWPYRDIGTPVYEYTGTFQTISELTPGTGYWMNHSGVRTYNTGDEWPAGGIQLVVHDLINVHSGWNIIGVYEELVPASGLTTIPPGLMNGPVYGYSGGYYASSQLVPGRGYWVRCSSDGQIVIPDASLKSNNKETKWVKDNLPAGQAGLPDSKEGWGNIIITDAAGKSFTLYAVEGDSPKGGAGVDLDQYELPPLPPAGVFDVRYASGRIAEDINSSAQSIDLRGVTYPVRVKADGMDIRLQDVTGKEINTTIESGEEITISNPKIDKIMVSGQLLPTKYALEQNYPNPFNAATTIKFSIPNEVQVNLDLYDMLGAKVKELKNELMKPGYYGVKINANALASGVYFYRIQAGDFVQTKKMILLK